MSRNQIELFRDDHLGRGSFGIVCKARCNDLPCAAKLLHPILFERNDPISKVTVLKFEQECQFLSALKHPNIVQHLGTYRDPQSQMPVLLMELMNKNLTTMLEKSKKPLPYHTQVNLCTDICLALSYLHSNGIIHRDLSSNNVLLIADARAKLSDFGMSRLMSASPNNTSLTQCPGCTPYMAPEALSQPTAYSEKLDSFSFGVLLIQILTRRFPNPGPSSKTVKDPRSPTGNVQMPILEIERRKSDIDLIDPEQPLLAVGLHCLSYSENDRPTAHALCKHFLQVKESSEYKVCVSSAAQNDDDTLLKSIHELREELEVKKRQAEALQVQLQVVQKTKEDLQRKNERQCQEMKQMRASSEAQWKLLENAKEGEIQAIKFQNEGQQQQQVVQMQEQFRNYTWQIQELQQHLQKKDEEVKNLQSKLDSNSMEWNSFNTRLISKNKDIQNLSQELQEKEQQIQEMQLWMNHRNSDSMCVTFPLVKSSYDGDCESDPKTATSPVPKQSPYGKESSVDKTKQLFSGFKGILDGVDSQNVSERINKAKQLKLDNEDDLVEMATTFFAKIMKEPKSSEVLARMAEELFTLKVKPTRSTGTSFRKELLTLSQQEFQKKDDKSTEKKALQSALKDAENRMKDCAQQLEEYEVKMRQRSLANMEFIAHLYNKLLISDYIIHNYCIEQLLFASPVNEWYLECSAKLFLVAGKTIAKKSSLECLNKYHKAITTAAEKVQSSHVSQLLQQVLHLLARECENKKATE